jgi:molybdate transport system permease protein
MGPSAFALSPDDVAAILLSLRIAAVATLASVPLAVGVALLIERRRFPGRQALGIAVHLPLVLPPVVTGYVLLVLFGPRGPIGSWLASELGIVLAFRWTGAVLACAVVSFPLLVGAIRLSLAGMDRGLEEAASTLGASPLWVFVTVTLPLVLPGILAGAALAFARSLGEFGATITFVSSIPGETRTIASAIYGWTQSPSGDLPALRLCLVSVALAIGSLLASEWTQRRLGRWVQGE